MVTCDEPAAKTIGASELLLSILDSGVLSDRKAEEIRKNARAGHYPDDSAGLAARLVVDRALTKFQARHFLQGKTSGLVMGRYVILDYLGKGTMGKVYRARHLMMGREVALKIVSPRFAGSARAVARFRREMQLVGRLDHPNVVRAFDADRVGEFLLIAMEYLRGQTLEQLLRARGPLPAADVVHYASQAARGLAHAHERGILHRDVKPSNLLLSEGGQIKVLDFGLGTLLEKEDRCTSLTDDSVTVGSPDYISPEQARKHEVDARSDLFSLGCAMYHLMSDRLPFPGKTSVDCLIGRLTGRPVPIEEVLPGLPPKLIRVMEKLLAVQPEDRYQGAAEAAEALQGLLRPKAPGTSGRPTPTYVVYPPDPEPAAPRLPAETVDSLPHPAQKPLAKPLLEWMRLLIRDRRRALGITAVALTLPIVIPLAYSWLKGSSSGGMSEAQAAARPPAIASVPAAAAAQPLPTRHAKSTAQPIEARDRASMETPEGSRVHQIAPGETLFGIAVKYYGDGGKWSVIYQANREAIGGRAEVIPVRLNLVIPELPAPAPLGSNARAD